MATEQEIAINSAMLTLGMADAPLGLNEEKIPAAIKLLQSVSLADMLAAKQQVERDNKEARAAADVRMRATGSSGSYSFSMIPDDRLIAAIYTWLHYAAPIHHQVGDGDESCLTLRINGSLHGLIVWAREVSNVESDEEAA
jgi:hypothetical protein